MVRREYGLGIIELVGTIGDFVCDPDHVGDWLHHGARVIKHFYKRPHADQILGDFRPWPSLLQEVVKASYGANPIPTPAPDQFVGSYDFGASDWLGCQCYPLLALGLLRFFRNGDRAVFAFLQFTTFGMVVRAGMADRETVGLLGINIDKRFTLCLVWPLPPWLAWRVLCTRRLIHRTITWAWISWFCHLLWLLWVAWAACRVLYWQASCWEFWKVSHR